MDEKRRRVLIVSDFPDWEDLVRVKLRGGRRRNQVSYVASGHAALTLAQQDPPDLIIYYLWTFDLSGYEFCRRLKTIPTLPTVPILLMGAVSPQLVYPEAQLAGAAGYIRQSIESGGLAAACDAVLKGETFFPTQLQDPKQWERASDKKGCRVLTCDYDPEMADLMQMVLGQRRNDELRYAQDAPELIAAAEQTPPDLIILPIRMPTMNGWEAHQQLRTIPSLRSVPVLFFAAIARSTAYPRVQQVGGQGYLEGPFGPQELLAARDALLSGETYFPQSEKL